MADSDSLTVDNTVVMLGFFCACRHLSPSELVPQTVGRNMFLVSRDVLDHILTCGRCHQVVNFEWRVPTQQELDESEPLPDSEA